MLRLIFFIYFIFDNIEKYSPILIELAHPFLS